MDNEIKVSELNRATSLNNDDTIMIIQSGNNKKVSINKLFEKFKNIVSPVILWENETPTAEMGANVEINLINDNYDELVWFYIYSNLEANLNVQSSACCLKGNTIILSDIGYQTNIKLRRKIEYVNDLKYKTTVAKNEETDSTAHLIPVKVVGIKYFIDKIEDDDISEFNKALNEYIEAFNNNVTEKTEEFYTNVNLKKQEVENIKNDVVEMVSNNSKKYARALPGQVKEKEFEQIYTDNPVIENLEIKGTDTNVNNITIKKCKKNLFDKNNASFVNAYIASNSETLVGSKNNPDCVYIKCYPNTTYTISKTADKYFSAAYTKDIPAVDVAVFNRTWNNTGSTITITTGLDAKYLVIRYFATTYSTLTREELLNSLQIEIGNKATEYESYEEIEYTITLPENKFLDANSCIKKISNKWNLVGNEAVELPETTQTILNSIELYEDINNIAVDGGTISFKYNKSLARVIEDLYRLANVNNTNTVQESEVLSDDNN